MANNMQIAGLWKQKFKDKEGNEKTFLSGNIGGVWDISVWPNDRKETDKHPDYQVTVTLAYKIQQTVKKVEGMGDTVAPGPLGAREDDVAF